MPCTCHDASSHDARRTQLRVSPRRWQANAPLELVTTHDPRYLPRRPAGLVHSPQLDSRPRMLPDPLLTTLITKVFRNAAQRCTQQWPLTARAQAAARPCSGAAHPQTAAATGPARRAAAMQNSPLQWARPRRRGRRCRRASLQRMLRAAPAATSQTSGTRRRLRAACRSAAAPRTRRSRSSA
eukprot:358421-Chlamydomonas_euryale.AAC.1